MLNKVEVQAIVLLGVRLLIAQLLVVGFYLVLLPHGEPIAKTLVFISTTILELILVERLQWPRTLPEAISMAINILMIWLGALLMFDPWGNLTPSGFVSIGTFAIAFAACWHQGKF